MHQQTVIPIDSDPLLPAAMAALGFTVRPNVHAYPDGPSQAAYKKVTWMVSEMSADGVYNGKELVPGWLTKSLLSTNPNHPVIAGMMALQTRQVLADWKKGIHGKPHVVRLTGSKLARAIPPSTRSQGVDLLTRLSGGTEGMTLDHAAAAITAGHGVDSANSYGCNITTSGAFSLVTGGMLAAAAAQIELDPRKSATMPLPGYAPGEHPFLYALSAIKQLRELAEAAKRKDPTLHLSSRAGKVALVSQSIMEGANAFKEHVHNHIR